MLKFTKNNVRKKNYILMCYKPKILLINNHLQKDCLKKLRFLYLLLIKSYICVELTVVF